MQKKNEPLWGKDFAEFHSIEATEVPSQLSEKVLGRIHAELHPSPFLVFGKTTAIHLLAGLVTLLFCPQFGVSFTSNMGVMGYLMRFGESVCMLGCGALFMALSLFIASFALKPEEVRTLKGSELFQLAGLSALSLAVFICAGAEVVFSLGIIWFAGAVLGGILSLEAGWILRRRLAFREVG